jgi:Protein of unknown function/AsmA-like C-terminal region
VVTLSIKHSIMLDQGRASGRVIKLAGVFFKWIGRFSAALATFALIIAIAIYLYLHSGPIDLAVVKPRIELALARAAPGVEFTIGNLSAERDAFRREVIIKVSSITAATTKSDSSDAFSGSIESLIVVLPQNELLAESPKPKTLLANGIRGTLNWDAAQLREKLREKDSDGPPRLYWPAGLGTLRIENAELKLRERTTDQRDVLTVTRLQAKKGVLRARHIDLDVSANLAAADSAARLAISGSAIAVPRAQWDAKFECSAIQPQRFIALLAPETQLPESLPRISAAIKLQATDMLGGSGNIFIRPGALSWQKYFAKPLAIKSVSTDFYFFPKQNRLALTNAKANIDGAAFLGSAILNVENIARSQVQTRFDSISITQLKSLWPLVAAPGGRAWVVNNIPKGTLQNGRFELRPAANRRSAPQVKLTFGFQDLQAEYRRPMPPLLKAGGNGYLNNLGLTLNLNTGSVGALPITKAVISVGPFPKSEQYADISADLSGDLTKLLLILDSKPLEYISRFKQDATKITGNVIGKLSLRIPLTRQVSFDDIILSSSAMTQNAQVPDVYAGKSLKGAELAISVTNSGLVATGTASLGNLPLKLKWIEDFTGKAQTPTQYDVTTQTTVADIAGIGIDLTNFGGGPVKAQLQLGGRGGSISDGTFSANLAQTLLTLTPFGIVKPIGVAGQISGRFAQTGRSVTMSNIILSGPAVAAEMTARIPLDDGRSEYNILNFKYRKNWLKGTVRHGDSLPLELNIEDGELDLREQLEDFRTNRTPTGAPVVQEDIPMNLNGSLRAVHLLNDVALNNVQFNANLQNNLFRQVLATALINNRAPLRFGLDSNGTARLLELRAEDAGMLAKGLDLMRDGRGGILSASANLRGTGPQLAITGSAKITKFRLQKTPALAKLLTIASLTGLSDTLSGRGIEFRKIEVPFTLKRGIVEVRNATAIGPALGLTLSGQAARTSGKINMRGTIVPSYTLNAAVGKIPVLGKIIVGGKDQGLIGFNYRITGTINNPQVDIVRSSGLAPGFLRRLFDGKAATVETPPEKSYSIDQPAK